MESKFFITFHRNKSKKDKPYPWQMTERFSSLLAAAAALINNGPVETEL